MFQICFVCWLYNILLNLKLYTSVACQNLEICVFTFNSTLGMFNEQRLCSGLEEKQYDNFAIGCVCIIFYCR